MFESIVNSRLSDTFKSGLQVISNELFPAGFKLVHFVLASLSKAASGLAERCRDPTVGIPTNEAYLMHGTNPTSATAIMGTSFMVPYRGLHGGNCIYDFVVFSVRKS